MRTLGLLERDREEGVFNLRIEVHNELADKKRIPTKDEGAAGSSGGGVDGDLHKPDGMDSSEPGQGKTWSEVKLSNNNSFVGFDPRERSSWS